MSVYGIDLSTSKIAIAKLLPNEGFEVVELISKSKSWEIRFKELYSQMFPWVRDSIAPDDLVCIEDIPLVQYRQSLIKLVHILAMCRTVFAHHDLDVFTVNVMTWKKMWWGMARPIKTRSRLWPRRFLERMLTSIRRMRLTL